jgi:hypothetical protein
VATNRKSLKQAGRSEPVPAAAIRFSDGDGKVLSWTVSRNRVPIELQVRGGLRRAIPLPTPLTGRPTHVVDNSGEAIISLSDHREGDSAVKPANNFHTDFTLVSGYGTFFRLLAAGTAFGILKAVFGHGW